MKASRGARAPYIFMRLLIRLAKYKLIIVIKENCYLSDVVCKKITINEIFIEDTKTH